jgi:hypothetical protein
MMSYDGCWLVDFYTGTPSKHYGRSKFNSTILGANAVADSTAPSAYITFNKYYFKQSVKFALDSFHRCCWCN